MSTYTFINELKGLHSSEQLRKEWCIKLANKRYVWNGYSFGNKEGTSASNSIFTLFKITINLKTGEQYKNIQLIEIPFKEFIFGTWVSVNGPRQKNGIEVLGLRPNAKKTTYSDDCKITVSKLKEACKINGIKCTGLSKTEMMGKLMKV